MKKVIVLLCVVVLIVISVQCCFFFGLIGKIGLIYLPEYTNSNIEQNHFVNPEKISSLSIQDYNSYLQMQNSLKYCNNIVDFGVDFEYKTVSDIKFLSYFPDLQSVCISGKSDDWSGISECRKLKELVITKSDFSDLSYLKNLKNLEWLEIRTSDDIILSGQVDFLSLKNITIESPNVDVSFFDSAKNISSLGLCVEEIKNINSLRSFSNLKRLNFIGTYINADILYEISDLDTVENIGFSKCIFSNREADINIALSKYFERNASVRIDECKFVMIE